MTKCEKCGQELTEQKEVQKVKIQIKNCSGALLSESEKTTIKEAVVEAVEKNANLYNADLYGANLSEANLGGANLSEANLSEANLNRANLYNANLYNANLGGANLNRANLYNANLYGANLCGAELDSAKFCGKGGTVKLTKEQVPVFLAALGFVIDNN
jgi:uncharacterized protein YjbI with pentapeptide repeats